MAAAAEEIGLQEIEACAAQRVPALRTPTQRRVPASCWAWRHWLLLSRLADPAATPSVLMPWTE